MAESIVVQTRLHPSNPHEKRAMAVYRRLQTQGFSTRQILTDALLRLDGATPEMFDDRGTNSVNARTLVSRIETELSATVERLLTDFARELLSQGGGALALARQEDDDDETTVDAYAARIAQSYLRGRKDSN